jgi:beta-phosphoglucomutase-like phosphatase (HAD superfamily)
MNSTPDLVIFDCDGVLVDSEVISNRIFMESFAELGIVFTLEELLAFGVGKNAVTLAAAIEQEFGVTLPANFFEDMGARIIAAYPGKLRPMDGIPELLMALKLKRCVASNSPLTRVQHALTTTGLLPHFAPHVYTAAMIARSKPAPDLFLHAAAQHDVRPDRCLIIEDSLSGVVAALAAGMPVIGFVGGSHCRPGHADAMRDAGCVEVFARMAEVAMFLDGHQH